jgi:hypothetical protein
LPDDADVVLPEFTNTDDCKSQFPHKLILRLIANDGEVCFVGAAD